MFTNKSGRSGKNESRGGKLMAKQEVEQLSFEEINLDEDWKKEWQGMPEYSHEDLAPWRTIYVHFRNRQDLEAFEKQIGQKIIQYAGGPGSVWYPELEIGHYANKRYINES